MTMKPLWIAAAVATVAVVVAILSVMVAIALATKDTSCNTSTIAKKDNINQNNSSSLEGKMVTLNLGNIDIRKIQYKNAFVKRC